MLTFLRLHWAPAVCHVSARCCVAGSVCSCCCWCRDHELCLVSLQRKGGGPHQQLREKNLGLGSVHRVTSHIDLLVLVSLGIALLALYDYIRLLLTLVCLIYRQVSAEADLSDAELEASIPSFLMTILRLCTLLCVVNIYDFVLYSPGFPKGFMSKPSRQRR